MRRTPGVRTVIVALALVIAGGVIAGLVSGLDAVIAEALGSGLEAGRRARLAEALRERLVVRGLLLALLAGLLAWLVASAIARAYDTALARGLSGERPAGLAWLGNARRLGRTLARDREERTAALRELERQHVELDRLMATISEGILQLDGDGRVVRANPAARRLLGLPDDVVGGPLEAVVRGAELGAALRRATREGSLAPLDVAVGDRTLVVTARPVSPGPAGTDVPGGAAAGRGVAVTIIDYTPVRRLESVRRDFVANASHELKTPLTSIRGYAETLLGEDVAAETRHQFLETIFANADRLQRIVDDLLDLSRLESGRWQPELQVVDVVEQARLSWRECERRAAARGISFEVRAEGETRVLADPSALRQILANLYDNALRHTEQGSVTTAVGARPANDGRADAAHAADAGEDADVGEDADGAGGGAKALLAIEVRDTGTGIPGDALPRIFERFYRVDPARSRAEGGTGLGLSIVKHLTESMGGRVEAESQLGKGTTLRVYLPAVRSEAAAG